MIIKDIENIEPKNILSWFKKICSIPHGSYHEKEISDWLKKTCEELGCDKVIQYPSGMILANKKASNGYENKPVILMQSHMDMVLAKTADCTKDLLKSPIDVYYDSEKDWISADKTTLGGDNGIGVAVMLAVMSDNSIKHGPIQFCFTTNEEDNPGVCIKNDLKKEDIFSHYYVNVDGTGVDRLTYGSAGCITAKYDNPVEYVLCDNLKSYHIELTDYRSGHSGAEIHKPHLNAIVQLAEVLLTCINQGKLLIQVTNFLGGPINNAIPAYASCDVQIKESDVAIIENFFKTNFILCKKICQGYEEKINFKISKCKEHNSNALSVKDTIRFLTTITCCPNKVFIPEKNFKCMFSSSNIGYVELCSKCKKFKVDYKVRGFIDDDVERNVNKIHAYMTYFGWKKKINQGQCKSFINDIINNKMAQIWKKSYKKIIGEEIISEIIPGGLELAELCAKKPSLTKNTICVATTVLNEHSTDEAIPVRDLKVFWNVLKDALENVN